MLESKLEQKLFAGVQLKGGIAVKLISSQRGLPDRLVLLPGGVSYLVELKSLTGSLEPSQVLWHKRAAEIGHTVIVLKGPAELKAWLDSLPVPTCSECGGPNGILGGVCSPCLGD